MSKYRFDQIAINSTAKKKPTEEDKYHYIGLEHLDSQNLIVSRWGSEVAPKGEKLLMKKGDVLFGKRRAYQRKVAIAPFDGIFSAHGMVLRPNEEVVDKDFFPMFISSDYFLDAAIAISVGSLSPTINWKDLARLEFDLPPMEEQGRLAEALWSINDTLQAYQNLLTQTDALVQAQFVEMFGAKTNCTIGDVCQLINGDRGKNYPSGKDRVSVGIPFINAGHLDGYKVNFAEMDYITPQKYSQMTQGKVQKEDILYCLRGSLGKHGIVDFESGLIASSLVIIRCNKRKILPLFLLNVLESDEIAVQLHAATNGSSQPNLSAASVKKYKIPLPEMKEQVAFVQFCECANNSKFALQNTITSLQATKHRILEDALGTGRKE